VYCPINGGWSHWSNYGQCSVSCGHGLQARSRTCTDPAAQYDGKNCRGDANERQPCKEIHYCPVDGGWTPWSDYGECSATCGSSGTRYRTRSCANPSPEYGGAECPGYAKESGQCQEKEYCPVDGSWSHWSNFGQCSASCGSGTVLQNTNYYLIS
jgi:hemicentin